MKYTQPYLEKYAGRKSRHQCPKCEDKYSFTYYMGADTGQVIDRSVGRCDHESSCGYHYTPKQYFEDNPNYGKVMGRVNQNDGKTTARAIPQLRSKEPGRIPKQYLIQSIGYKSNFIAFLCSLFDIYTLESPNVERLMSDYYLGCTKNEAVIYWQLDSKKRICTGKIMQYDPNTGRRVKSGNGAIDWVHAKLKRDKVFPDDFNLVQCLFGEHLLIRYPDRIVALVESEKSALIAAGVYPEYIWLATGGKSQLSADKLNVLRGRTVIMFPDVDAYSLWTDKAKEMEAMGINVVVSDTLEKNATQADRDAQIDVADWLIRELKIPEIVTEMPSTVTNQFTDEEKKLAQLGTKNPNIYTLVDALGLVSTTTGEKLMVSIT